MRTIERLTVSLQASRNFYKKGTRANHRTKLRALGKSHEPAENIYKIAYEPERRKIDVEKTKQQRLEERNARLARGVSFDRFHQQWNKKTPPKEALQFYGTWPDAKATGPVFRP